jgi:hypothetical protein
MLRNPVEQKRFRGDDSDWGRSDRRRKRRRQSVSRQTGPARREQRQERKAEFEAKRAKQRNRALRKTTATEEPEHSSPYATWRKGYKQRKEERAEREERGSDLRGFIDDIVNSAWESMGSEVEDLWHGPGGYVDTTKSARGSQPLASEINASAMSSMRNPRTYQSRRGAKRSANLNRRSQQRAQRDARRDERWARNNPNRIARESQGISPREAFRSIMSGF